MRATVVLLALLGLLFATASPASAHSELESTAPAADSASTEPVDGVVLTFSDSVQPGFAQIAVLDPGGTDIADGEPTIDGDTVTQPVAMTTTGQYSVSYRIVSADGHTVQGTYAFTASVVDGQSRPTTDAPRAFASTPSTSAPSSAAASPAAQEQSAEGQDSGLGTGQTIAILVVLALGLVGTAAITVARRRHRKS
jgi:methionine-rich copper-binding protein CopC